MITAEEIKKLAILARLELAPETIAGFGRDLEAILAYVSVLQKAPRSAVERAPALKNVLRPDEGPEPAGEHTPTLLKLAPRQRDGYVEVRQIISYDN